MKGVRACAQVSVVLGEAVWAAGKVVWTPEELAAETAAMTKLATSTAEDVPTSAREMVAKLMDNLGLEDDNPTSPIKDLSIAQLEEKVKAALQEQYPSIEEGLRTDFFKAFQLAARIAAEISIDLGSFQTLLTEKNWSSTYDAVGSGLPPSGAHGPAGWPAGVTAEQGPVRFRLLAGLAPLIKEKVDHVVFKTQCDEMTEHAETLIRKLNSIGTINAELQKELKSTAAKLYNSEVQLAAQMQNHWSKDRIKNILNDIYLYDLYGQEVHLTPPSPSPSPFSENPSSSETAGTFSSITGKSDAGEVVIIPLERLEFIQLMETSSDALKLVVKFLNAKLTALKDMKPFNGMFADTPPVRICDDDKEDSRQRAVELESFAHTLEEMMERKDFFRERLNEITAVRQTIKNLVDFYGGAPFISFTHTKCPSTLDQPALSQLSSETFSLAPACGFSALTGEYGESDPTKGLAKVTLDLADLTSLLRRARETKRNPSKTAKHKLYLLREQLNLLIANLHFMLDRVHEDSSLPQSVRTKVKKMATEWRKLPQFERPKKPSDLAQLDLLSQPKCVMLLDAFAAAMVKLCEGDDFKLLLKAHQQRKTLDLLALHAIAKMVGVSGKTINYDDAPTIFGIRFPTDFVKTIESQWNRNLEEKKSHPTVILKGTLFPSDSAAPVPQQGDEEKKMVELSINDLNQFFKTSKDQEPDQQALLNFGSSLDVLNKWKLLYMAVYESFKELASYSKENTPIAGFAQVQKDMLQRFSLHSESNALILSRHLHNILKQISRDSEDTLKSGSDSMKLLKLKTDGYDRVLLDFLNRVFEAVKDEQEEAVKDEQEEAAGVSLRITRIEYEGADKKTKSDLIAKGFYSLDGEEESFQLAFANIPASLDFTRADDPSREATLDHGVKMSNIVVATLLDLLRRLSQENLLHTCGHLSSTYKQLCKDIRDIQAAKSPSNTSDAKEDGKIDPQFIPETEALSLLTKHATSIHNDLQTRQPTIDNTTAFNLQALQWLAEDTKLALEAAADKAAELEAEEEDEERLAKEKRDAAAAQQNAPLLKLKLGKAQVKSCGKDGKDFVSTVKFSLPSLPLELHFSKIEEYLDACTGRSTQGSPSPPPLTPLTLSNFFVSTLEELLIMQKQEKNAKTAPAALTRQLGDTLKEFVAEIEKIPEYKRNELVEIPKALALLRKYTPKIIAIVEKSKVEKPSSNFRALLFFVNQLQKAHDKHDKKPDDKQPDDKDGKNPGDANDGAGSDPKTNPNSSWLPFMLKTVGGLALLTSLGTGLALLHDPTKIEQLKNFISPNSTQV